MGDQLARSTVNAFDVLRRDLVYGWRSLRRTPGITAVSILSFAIVLGANTAMFAIVDAMYLRRLDLPRAEQLAAVVPVKDGRAFSLKYAQYRALEAAPAGTQLEAVRFEPATAVRACPRPRAPVPPRHSPRRRGPRSP